MPFSVRVFLILTELIRYVREKIDSQFMKWLRFRVLGLGICTRILLGIYFRIIDLISEEGVSNAVKRYYLLGHCGILNYKCRCTFGSDSFSETTHLGISKRDC